MTDYTNYTLHELADDLLSYAFISAYANSRKLDYDDNNFNHSELEREVSNLEDSINDAVDRFTDVTATRMYNIQKEINSRAPDPHIIYED